MSHRITPVGSPLPPTDDQQVWAEACERFGGTALQQWEALASAAAVCVWDLGGTVSV